MHIPVEMSNGGDEREVALASFAAGGRHDDQLSVAGSLDPQLAVETAEFEERTIAQRHGRSSPGTAQPAAYVVTEPRLIGIGVLRLIDPVHGE